MSPQGALPQPGVQAHDVSGKPKSRTRHPLETLSQGQAAVTAQAGDTLFFKTQLRQQLRRARQKLAPAERRHAMQQAAKRALRFTPLRQARHVAVYLAVGSELHTGPLLKALQRRGCALYLPKLGRASMRFLAIRPQTPLRKNRHGIPEPVQGYTRPPKRLDVVILPLVGFDANGTRLGAGGGHYDRALAGPRRFRRPLRVGYAYAIQEHELLPREAWDVALDALITDKRIWRWPTG